MRLALFAASMLAIFVLANAISTNEEFSRNLEAVHAKTEGRRFPKVKCDSKCFFGRRSLKKAQRVCKGRKEFCAVEKCQKPRKTGKRGKVGYRCASLKPVEKTVTPTPTTTPTPTPTPTPSMVPIVGPISEGPIEIPESITFPSDITIGGTVEVEVTVVLDEVSSSLREDIYLLSDATGSMREEIASAQDRFGMLVAARQNASLDVAFGVGFYRDEEENPNFKNVQAITKNIASVITAIDSLFATGGADNPEANLFALSQVATQDSIGWREGTRKILVYFGDAPGHEPTCAADSVALTRDVVVDQLNAKGIAVVGTNFASNVNGGLNAATFSARGATFGCPSEETSPSGQASRITGGTMGALKLASDPKDLIELITETIGSLDQELSAETMDCAGRVAVTFSPDLPISISPGETKTIIERAEILPGACEFPDGFTCTIDINLSGVGVKQTIATTSIAGCVPDDGSGFLV